MKKEDEIRSHLPSYERPFVRHISRYLNISFGKALAISMLEIST